MGILHQLCSRVGQSRWSTSEQFWGHSSLELVVVVGYTAGGLGVVGCTVVGFVLVGCIGVGFALVGVGCTGVGFALVVVGCTGVDSELVGCIVVGFGAEGHEANVVSKVGGFVFEAVGVFEEEDFLLVGEGCMMVGWVAVERLSRICGW